MDINPSEKNSANLEDVLIASDLKYTAGVQPGKFPRPRNQLWWNRVIFAGIGLTISVVLAVVFLGGDEDSELSVDETNRVELFVQRNEEILPWKDKRVVRIGDQLAVRILTARPAIAWMDIYLKSGKPTDQEPSHQIATTSSNPSIIQEFEKKFPLSTTDPEQVLVVLICSKKSLEGLQPNPGELADWMDGIFNHDQEFMNGCTGSRIPLQ
jgi:hypothetical protein